jgi:tripartite-type tricarboxylate transporter receptor subunit TctC
MQTRGFRLRSGHCAAVLLVAVLAGLVVGPASAQDFPTRPIRMLIGFAPGASTDVFARVIATELQQDLGQPVVVESRSGANGTIATAELVRSTPDGHTLMMAISSHVTNGLYYRNLPYDPVRDVTPVVEAARAGWVLLASNDFPANTIQELITLARARPGEIDYASAGESSPPHLFAVLLGQAAGIRMTHVPYRGSSQAMVDVVAGRVPLLFGTIALAREQIAGRKVKALGIATLERSRMLPEVPTIAEQGLPGFQADIWFGIIGPPHMPAPIVSRLETAIMASLRRPEVRQRFGEQDAEVVNGDHVSFRRKLEAEQARWRRIFHDADLARQ